MYSAMYIPPRGQFRPTAQQIGRKQQLFTSTLNTSFTPTDSTNYQPPSPQLNESSQSYHSLLQLINPASNLPLLEKEKQTNQQFNQQSPPISIPTTSTTTLFPYVPTTDPNFHNSLQDIITSSNTFYILDKYSQIFPPLTHYERYIANLVVTHGNRFLQYLDRNVITNIDQTKPLYQILQQQPNSIRLQHTLYESTIAEITYEFIVYLKPGRWLCMEVVNGFFSLLLQRQKKLHLVQATMNNQNNNTTSLSKTTMTQHQHQQQQQLSMKTFLYPTFFPLSSQFFSIFLNKDDEYDKTLYYKYSLVQRWSLRAKTIINNQDLVLVPCHVDGNHWTLVVADMKNRIISYYDSFGGNDEGRCQLLAQYLYDEYITYGGWNGYYDEHYAIYDPKAIKTTINNNIVTNSNGKTSNQGAINTVGIKPLMNNICKDFQHPDRIGSNVAIESSGYSNPYIHTNNNENNENNEKNENNQQNNIHFNNMNDSHSSPQSQPTSSQSPPPIIPTQSISPLLPQQHLPPNVYYKPFTWGLTTFIPQQHNQCDCGVFVCAFANALTLGVNVKGVTQENYQKHYEQYVKGVTQENSQKHYEQYQYAKKGNKVMDMANNNDVQRSSEDINVGNNMNEQNQQQLIEMQQNQQQEQQIETNQDEQTSFVATNCTNFVFGKVNHSIIMGDDDNNNHDFELEFDDDMNDINTYNPSPQINNSEDLEMNPSDVLTQHNQCNGQEISSNDDNEIIQNINQNEQNQFQQQHDGLMGITTIQQDEDNSSIVSNSTTLIQSPPKLYNPTQQPQQSSVVLDYAHAELTTRLIHSRMNARDNFDVITLLPMVELDMNEFRYRMVIAFMNQSWEQ